jgi:hypothetical protein
MGDIEWALWLVRSTSKARTIHMLYPTFRTILGIVLVVSGAFASANTLTSLPSLVDDESQSFLDELGHRLHHPVGRFLRPHEDVAVSGRREFHPPALSEPDLNLSAHPAPIIQPPV